MYLSCCVVGLRVGIARSGWLFYQSGSGGGLIEPHRCRTAPYNNVAFYFIANFTSFHFSGVT